MKATIAALALVAGLASVPAFAQDSMTMDEALSMLELTAARELSQFGLDKTDVMDLTLNQLAEIKFVTQSSDYNESEKQQQIESIIAN